MKEIKLNKGMVALVDDQDFEWLNSFKWYAHKRKANGTFYVLRSFDNMKMHRLILSPEPCQIIDHKDDNGLNNQRYNIRICTPSQNTAKKRSKPGKLSVYKGVYFMKNATPGRLKRWRAYGGLNNKNISLGYFLTEIEAAIAYNEFAKNHHGEFARLNIIA